MARSPIQRRLLIHSIVHKTGRSEDIEQNVTWVTSTDVTHVRLEPVHSMTTSQTDRERVRKLVLFHDATNSSPATETYTVGDYVTWNGTDYEVQSVDYLYDDTRLHHLEVGLV